MSAARMFLCLWLVKWQESEHLIVLELGRKLMGEMCSSLECVVCVSSSKKKTENRRKGKKFQ
jgi:hypothetical protein